ncbi:MAG: hypothetical protein E7Z74_06625 [Methanobrevibacter millerae]|uniref:Uncharacterized protein n=1 Tax=Methanobrevibacter millerae TaxID=230361 RepID=A0A8T3VHE7_9EURY|nr:hypothetical protein [Methanobrevibacter millerae]
MNKKTFKILGTLLILVCALTLITAVSSTETKNDENGNCTLQINTTGSWRLDLVVDGKYSSLETEGSKTIDLNTTDLNFTSVTINQKSGPTDVFLVKDNKTLHEEHSKGNGIETIYFYYQGK